MSHPNPYTQCLLRASSLVVVRSGSGFSPLRLYHAFVLMQCNSWQPGSVSAAVFLSCWAWGVLNGRDLMLNSLQHLICRVYRGKVKSSVGLLLKITQVSCHTECSVQQSPNAESGSPKTELRTGGFLCLLPLSLLAPTANCHRPELALKHLLSVYWMRNWRQHSAQGCLKSCPVCGVCCSVQSTY